jgi:hypothetical protein
MTLDEMLAAMDEKSLPVPLDALKRFEETLGTQLPNDYREFLVRCNGGYVAGGVRFCASTSDGVVLDLHLNHLGGFRKENHFSVEFARNNYQKYETRIPSELIWIADDP